jgi:hypothetical protein
MRHLGIFALITLTAACSGKTADAPADTPPDQPADQDTGTAGDDAAPADTGPADTGPAIDMTPPSDTYPAYKAWMPQLANNGGAVLSNPEVVTITWPDEPNADTFEAFGDAIGGSAYWKTLVSEYGVGAAVSGETRHVRMKDAAPASITDTDLDALVAKNAADPTSGWPAPTDQTIYVLYLPQSTKLMMSSGGGKGGSSGDACSQGIGGYHMSTDVGGKQVSYAILPQCPKFGPIPGEVTLSASHEIAEAATDPQPNDNPGWVDFDDDYLAWYFFQQGAAENGDMCEFYETSNYTETESGFAYNVQRQWSNASGAAGHDPCVPVAPGAYFNVAPLDMETVTATLGGGGGGGTTIKAKGYKVLVGETKTFTIGFYSDAKTDPWTIKVYESNPLLGTPTTSHLTVSVDKTSGQNGEKAHVTVSVSSQGRSKTEYITVVSTQGKRQTFMPILIGSQ